MCFCESSLTTKDGTFTTCLRTNMPLANKGSGVVDRFGVSKFEHLGLETSFQEIFNSETKNEIEFHFILTQYSNTN